MPPRSPPGEPPRTLLHGREPREEFCSRKPRSMGRRNDTGKGARSRVRAYDALLRSLGKEGRGMRVVEASAVVPLSPEEAWDLLIGDQMHRSSRCPTFRWSLSRISRYGPTERPVTSWPTRRGRPRPGIRPTSRSTSVRTGRSTVLDSPFGGMFYGTYQPVGEGTRVHWRWEVEAQNTLAGLLLPVMHPLLARSMQQDLDALAKGFGPQEDRQRRSAARLAGPGVIVLIAACMLSVSTFSRGEEEHAQSKPLFRGSERTIAWLSTSGVLEARSVDGLPPLTGLGGAG